MIIINQIKKPDTITVRVLWNTPESIEAAEKRKFELENDGYEQIDTINKFSETIFVYQKENYFPEPETLNLLNY